LGNFWEKIFRPWSPGNIWEMSEKRAKHTWTRAETLLLIEEVDKMIKNKELSQKKVAKKKDTWEKVAKNLDIPGIDWDKAFSKLNTLMKQYKDIKDNNSTSGAGRQDFPYMEEFEEIYSNHPIITPAFTESSLSTPSSEQEAYNKLDEELNEPKPAENNGIQGLRSSGKRVRLTPSAKIGMELVEILQSSKEQDRLMKKQTLTFFQQMQERQMKFLHDLLHPEKEKET
jgi:hypothetical protein